MSNYRLASCPKHFKGDQDKAVAPAETVKLALDRLKKQFDLSGLRLEEREAIIEGAFSFASVSDQLTASGKGLTLEQSEASAIMEFAERYSWLHFDYKKYDGYQVKSYNEMKKWNFPVPGEDYFFSCFPDVPNKEALLAEVKQIPLKWLKGLSLNGYRPFYYPLNWHNYSQTSNGLATGNAMEEAVCQALCEVIERENVYRFFEEKKVPRELDLRSVAQPLAARALVNAASRGIKLCVKDISFELGVPTFCVYGVDEARRGKLSYRGCGYGTHTDPDKALIRAIAEYFEGYALMTNVENEFGFNWQLITEKLPRKHFGFMSFYNAGMLEEPGKPVKLKDLRSLARDDIRDEVLELLAILRGEGHDVVFLDKTDPRVGIPVTRIFVPTFRTLIGTSVIDPDSLMCQAHFEAGNRAQAEKYYKKLLLKDYYINPEVSKVKIDQSFKEDYQQQIIAAGGIKRDIRETLKKFEQQLRQALKK